MKADVQFQTMDYTSHEIVHKYGANIHILKNPLALFLLSKLCSSETMQPDVTHLLKELYRLLAYEVVAREFPSDHVVSKTRMYEQSTLGLWQGICLAQDPKVIVVALARAGLLPSQITYEFLNQVFVPSHIRQDHLSLGRVLDGEGRVLGAGLHSVKIGGSVDDAILLIPDPMGATGSTVDQVLQHYHLNVQGAPRKMIAMHLIVTPEYLRFIKQRHPQVIVYALRLDRGLSSEKVLLSQPGEFWEEEKGLTDNQYIVPGAGGLGELLNNSYS